MCTTPSAGGAIFDGLDFTARRGRITAIMGPSRHRQDHAAAADHRRSPRRAGQRVVFGARRRQLSHARAVRAAPAHGHAVPVRRAVHRSVVFENVAFPLREHTDLPEAADPRPGADEAARRRPARRGASSCRRSSPAAWRAAWRWRAPSRSTRNPDLRRAVRRPRSDLDGRDPAADQADERCARHHLHRRLARRAGARRPSPTTATCCPAARSSRRARRSELARERRARRAASSWAAAPTARCRSTTRRPTTSTQLLADDAGDARRTSR